MCGLLFVSAAAGAQQLRYCVLSAAHSLALSTWQRRAALGIPQVVETALLLPAAVAAAACSRELVCDSALQQRTAAAGAFTRVHMASVVTPVVTDTFAPDRVS